MRWFANMFLALLFAACTAKTAQVAHQRPSLSARAFPLPGGKPILMDYLVCDRATGRIWIPAGNTGSVDLIDGKNNSVTRIDGFAIGEKEIRGNKLTFGPSSAAVGDGVVYIGNRGDSSSCAVDGR